MVCRWRADDGPLIVVFWSFPPSSNLKKSVVKVGPPLTKHSASAHGAHTYFMHALAVLWCENRSTATQFIYCLRITSKIKIRDKTRLKFKIKAFKGLILNGTANACASLWTSLATSEGNMHNFVNFPPNKSLVPIQIFSHWNYSW